MTTSYARIWKAATEHPWAILPGALDVIVEILAHRLAGAPFSDAERATRIEVAQAARGREPATAPSTIAVIPIIGVMVHRMSLMTDLSTSGTSADAVARAVRGAAADPNIAAILLDVDSPGGSVFGVQELGDVIFQTRGQKPVWASINALGASAAYWAASQADQLIITPSGEAGSIGVVAVHEDVSGAAEQKGLKVTYITSSRYKAEGNQFQPLSDDARAHLQARVDAYADTFVRAVARGRSVPLKTVRGDFGEGRMFGAERALALGMVDRIEPFEATIERLARKIGASAGTGTAEGAPVHLSVVGTPSVDDAHALATEELRAALSETMSDAPPPGQAEPAQALDDLDRRRRRLRLAETGGRLKR